MSTPPSFYDDPPSIKVIRPDNNQEQSDEIIEAIQDPDKHICTMCKPPREFESAGGLGSHQKYKHIDPANDENNKLDTSIREIYEESDFLRLLLPNNTQKLYDRTRNIWVFTVGASIPDGYLLYQIVNKDVPYRATDTVNHPRSFTEVICIRKNKVVKL